MKKKIIYKHSESKRLDAFTREIFPYISRSLSLELLKDGNITVNGTVCLKGHKLKNGDEVIFSNFPEIKEIKLKPNNKIELYEIFNDGYFLAVNKQRGLPTHPNRHTETETLANALISKYPKLESIGDKELEPGLINRIDNDTSGIVLAALTEESFKRFKNLFKEKKIKKTYLALVLGTPPSYGRITYPILRKKRNSKIMDIMKDYSIKHQTRIYKAKTDFKLIKAYSKYSLLEITLKTAFSHQIRAHLASIGHPIMGDKLYQNKEFSKLDDFGLLGQFLHASKVDFSHPFTGEKVSIEAELPKKLSAIIDRLE